MDNDTNKDDTKESDNKVEVKSETEIEEMADTKTVIDQPKVSVIINNHEVVISDEDEPLDKDTVSEVTVQPSQTTSHQDDVTYDDVVNRIRDLEARVTQQENDIRLLQANQNLNQSSSPDVEVERTPLSEENKTNRIILRTWNKYMKIDPELVNKANRFISGVEPQLPITPKQKQLLNEALRMSTMGSEQALIDQYSLVKLKQRTQESFNKATRQYREAKDSGLRPVALYVNIFKMNVMAEHQRLRLFYGQQFLKGIAKNTGPATNLREITSINHFGMPTEEHIFEELQNNTRPIARFSSFNALWQFQDWTEAAAAASSEPTEMVIPKVKPKRKKN